LVNYDWEWDLNILKTADPAQRNLATQLRSADVSRVDLIIRWGGRRRLSGFLPVQSVYADFYVVDDLWPDFQPEHFYQALAWYNEQDITLGG
ncbi:MAG TPA: undecaprenyl diphosphate synthase family protein, partial [Bacillota bacterium]|nr:undecaprenyl diphosphate synthase family protein [Bacillota bacterium]